MITRETVAKMLGDYLHGDLALNELVDWSENSIAEEEFENAKLLEIVGRLGLADVRAFGLAWEDFREMLRDQMGQQMLEPLHIAKSSKVLKMTKSNVALGKPYCNSCRLLAFTPYGQIRSYHG